MEMWGCPYVLFAVLSGRSEDCFIEPYMFRRLVIIFLDVILLLLVGKLDNDYMLLSL